MLGMIVLMLMPLVGLLFFFVLPLPVAVPAYLAGCIVSLAMHHIMYRTAKLPVLTGRRGLVGRTAEVIRWEGSWGTVRCHDELWTATGAESFKPGEEASITAVDGLTVHVRRPTARGKSPAPRTEDQRRDRGGAFSPARRYDRLAPIYDLVDAPMDRFGGKRRRRRVLAGATGRTLEVGVGTGRNLGLYPPGVGLTGLDLSGRMLARAQARRHALRPETDLVQGDAERLPFPDDTFDTVTATCVFCSVDDPLVGLVEVRRVLKADGRALLLEHVRPTNPLLGLLFDLLTPLTRLIGPEINRRTVHTARAAGLELAAVRRAGVWREIEARPEKSHGQSPERSNA